MTDENAKAKTEAIISIDLGAQNTGIVFGDADTQTAKLINKPRGALLHLEKEQQWSQEPRRGARHMARGHRRRRLAKRLLWVIVHDKIADKSDSIAPPVVTFVNGLLNRRGFTFISEGLEEHAELFADEDGTILHTLAPDIFPAGVTVSRQLEKMSGDSEKALRHLIFAIHDLFGKEKPQDDKQKELWQDAQEFMKNCDDKRRHKKIYKEARNFLNSEQRAKSGHLPREEYLQNILKDISKEFNKSVDFAALLNLVGWSAGQFADIVGHISNLPLRLLRKYFNDKKMESKDFWDSGRFCLLLTHEVAAWYYEKDDTKADSRRNYLDEIASGWRKSNKEDSEKAAAKCDILAVWQRLSPKNTVPPFENQANRNPPKCMSLLLVSPKDEKLNIIIDAFVAEDKAHNKDATLLLSNNLDDKKAAYRARILQRILDRARARDKYNIRKLVFSAKSAKDKTNLDSMLAEYSDKYKSDYLQVFLDYAKQYYKESELGAQGAWSAGGDSILRRCGLNPPHKGKVKSALIARVLGCDEEQAQEAEKFICNKDNKAGRKGVFSICQDAAALQKKHGNEMKHLRDMEAAPQNKNIKEVKAIYEHAKRAAAEIAKCLGHDEQRCRRYADPFSLAQIYQHIIGVSGFSSTCKECSKDNAWRMRMSWTDEGEWAAAAKSLPSDSVRPFDGMLRRILEAQAAKIAKLQMAKLEDDNFDGTNTKLPITICIEQNAFHFTQGLNKIKSKQSKARVTLGLERMTQDADNKFERLRKNTICPYIGKTIKLLHIDHIIPRALAKFNSEANLIGCSAEGNTAKGDTQYFLGDLHKNYLRSVFETDNIDEIRRRIRDAVQPILDKSKEYTSFADLCKDAPDSAVCLRHALFVEDLYQQVITKILNTERKTRVNGTQRFLAKKVWDELDGHFTQRKWLRPSRKLLRADAKDVHAHRRLWLDDKSGVWDKSRQGAMSHVADAAIAYAVATHAETLPEHLLPAELHIEHLEKHQPWRRKTANARYKVFADGIYGERFLPLLIMANGDCKIGFAPDNSILIKTQHRQTWLTALAPFLRCDAADLATLTAKAKQHKDGYLRLSVNKQQAKEELLRHWQAVKDGASKQNEAADFLRMIHYIIRKQEIKKAICDDSGKKLHSRDKILDDTYFAVRVMGGTVDNGKVFLPLKEEWARLLSDDWLCKCLGKAKSADFEDKMKDIVGEFFMRGRERDGERQHYRHRTSHSLARLEKPAGAWRIRRRTPNGGHIFQLLKVGKNAYLGFAPKADKTADFQHKVPLDVFLNSRWLAPMNDIKKPAPPIFYDETEEVILPDNQKSSPVTKIYVSPHSTDGRLLRFVLPLSEFLPLIKQVHAECNDWRKIPAVIKHKPEFRTAMQNTLKLGVDSRDKIVILRINKNEVELQFITYKRGQINKLFNEARKKRGG